MASYTLTYGGTQVPGEIVSLKPSHELLWSEGTGRAATTGQMTGSVVAQKQTWEVEWGVVTKAQYDAIVSALAPGFKSLVITADGATVANITAYRSNISAELLGTFGGVTYYKGVTVELVER